MLTAMDYEAYRRDYFVEPEPPAKYGYGEPFGFALFFEAYEKAVAFYGAVFGPPAYVEGEFTRGWRLGGTWLTLLKSAKGDPSNAEIELTMTSEEDAARLQQAFFEAGGSIEEPAEVLMYEPVKIFPASDPFGTDYLFVVRVDS